jgi:hypothetical protein
LLKFLGFPIYLSIYLSVYHLSSSSIYITYHLSRLGLCIHPRLAWNSWPFYFRVTGLLLGLLVYVTMWHSILKYLKVTLQCILKCISQITNNFVVLFMFLTWWSVFQMFCSFKFSVICFFIIEFWVLFLYSGYTFQRYIFCKGIHGFWLVFLLFQQTSIIRKFQNFDEICTERIFAISDLL